MERLVELVRQLEPDTAQPPPGALSRQRAALFQSMEAADRTPSGPARRHPRRGGRFLAFAGAAAAAAVVAIGVATVPGWISPASPGSHPSGVAHGTSAVLSAVTTALAGTGGDIEEVRSTASVDQLGSVAWVDVATGACRTDTAVAGTPALTVFVEDGRAVVVDYLRRQWWSRSSEGVTCTPLTPRTIGQDVAAGRYSLAGSSTVDGRRALRLTSTTATPGLHPVRKQTTLWVDATTYLPIRLTSTGHATDETTFAWSPATAGNRAALEITVPAGFRQVAVPAPGIRPVP